MSEDLLNDLKRLLYLGSLYKKCNSNKGITEKEIKNRLKELKKYRVIHEDCNLNTFVKVCKLKTYPQETDKCHVDIDSLIKRLTTDRLVKYILNKTLDEYLLEYLLINFENIPVGLNLLEVCIEVSYNKNIIKILLEKLKTKNIKKIGNTISSIRSYIYPDKYYKINNSLFENVNQNPISSEMSLYDYDDILSIIKILNIDFNFQEIISIKKETFIREDGDIVFVNDEAIDFLKNLIQILIDRNIEIDIYSFGGFLGGLSEYFEEYSRQIHIDILSMIKENFDKEYRILISKTLNIMSYYGFINTYFLEALKIMNELSDNFDIEKYNQEYYEDEYQRNHLDKENVHQKSTNKMTNKYIKYLIPNILKSRDVLNEKRTRKYANDFIKFANKYNLNHNNITVDEILLCKYAFYDYDDKLRGRENTPPGEGVETCNIFIKIWELSRNLDLENKKEITIRLLEELFSILNHRENEPVCSTGWATRLINSLHGSAIDLQISPDPDKSIIKERINDYLKKVRQTLDDEEQEQFDDSIALISDTGFKFIRDLLFDNLIKEILEEFKNSDFTEVQIRNTFYNTVFDMFPYE